MTAKLYFISHPEVVIAPLVPVERWHLSAAGVSRMKAFASSPAVRGVRAVWSSDETKAMEAAAILAGALGVIPKVSEALRENDRRSTGYVPPERFERLADCFFAKPHLSVCGWERAVDAQARIVEATHKLVAAHVEGDLAIVGHGAVGSLLYCALSRNPISRAFDQPFQGHFWTATLPDLTPDGGWKPIADRS